MEKGFRKEIINEKGNSLIKSCLWIRRKIYDQLDRFIFKTRTIQSYDINN